MFVGRAPDVHQGERLAQRQTVPFDRVEHAILLLARQARELVGQRRPERARAECAFGLRREASFEREPTLNPRELVAEQSPDRARGQLLLDLEGTDHASFVERGARARRGVDGEEATLVFGDRSRWIDHHRHEAMAALAPSGEPFEAVDDFVPAVHALHDKQRHVRAEFGTHAGSAWS